MRRGALWLLLLALVAAPTLEAQRDLPARMDESGGSGVPAPSLADAGKVPAVNAGGTAYELIAVAGTGTVTSVGNGTIGALFSASWATETTTPAFSLNLATQAANCVIAGPTTGGNAVPTCRALVAADLGSFTLAPSLARLTLQDASGDTTPLTVRASAAAGTAHIAQFQASDNSPLSHIDHDGVWNGDVIGDVTGDVSGTAANVTGTVAVANGGTGLTTLGTALQVLRVNAGETGLEYGTVSGGGITNSAGANVLTKSDGTNLVASALSEASAGSLATSAGTALGLTATAPAATTGASQAGVGVTITASPAVASTDTAGAAAGGPIVLQTGAAARLTSGNAVGGDLSLLSGAGVGATTVGKILTNFRIIQQTSDSINLVLGSKVGPTSSGGSVPNVALTTSGAGAPGNVWGNSTGAIGFVSTATIASPPGDTFFRRRGAANPAWGAASATPVSYVHNFAADGSGTNIPGGAVRTGPGNGTGTGGSGLYGRTTSYPGSTGTTENTATDRDMLWPTWVDLTESTPTNFSTLTFAASTAVGAEWFVTVSANDGTDFQSLTSRVRVSSVRAAAGDSVSAINVVGTDLTSATSGTLTCTFTEVDGAAGVTVAADCVSSLTQTVLRLSWQAVVNGPATVGAP